MRRQKCLQSQQQLDTLTPKPDLATPAVEFNHLTKCEKTYCFDAKKRNTNYRIVYFLFKCDREKFTEKFGTFSRKLQKAV